MTEAGRKWPSDVQIVTYGPRHQIKFRSRTEDMRLAYPFRIHRAKRLQRNITTVVVFQVLDLDSKSLFNFLLTCHVTSSSSCFLWTLAHRLPVYPHFVHYRTSLSTFNSVNRRSLSWIIINSRRVYSYAINIIDNLLIISISPGHCRQQHAIDVH